MPITLSPLTIEFMVNSKLTLHTGSYDCEWFFLPKQNGKNPKEYYCLSTQTINSQKTLNSVRDR